MPVDFTVCAAYTVEAWTTDWSSANFFRLNNREQNMWADVSIFAAESYTKLTVHLGRVTLVEYSDQLLFPHTWSRICLSLDTVSGQVCLVLNGQVVEDREHQEAREEDEWRPANLDIVLGYSAPNEYTGMVSQVNMFSSPLSSARMVALTQAGGEECGAPGDYVSWEEAAWKLKSQARVLMVEELEAPCRRESELSVYTPPVGYYWAHQDCMEHCQKLGKGRSPPVRTLEERDWLREEVNSITPKISALGYLWLAATDREVEGDWRDAYSGAALDTGGAWPWYDTVGKDTRFGDEYNCLTWYTNQAPQRSWAEWDCNSPSYGCPCQYSQQPVLLLRGLCEGNQLNTLYTPKQLAGAPQDLMFLGQVSSKIQFNISQSQWVLSDAKYTASAVSDAIKVSHVLGKHEWTVSNDVFSCNKGKTYTTFLKLSGCNPEGEFTCDDGQCVTMEQRCNQIPNCRDESDEVDCKLLILKKNYNKKVPPMVPTKGDDFNKTEVWISISVLKIVSMKEVQHKIDIQFEITLEWKENRANYHNLKYKTSLNALTKDEIGIIWLPYVIYANTDMKEAVQLEDGLDTTIVVDREGNFTRSAVEELDEIEIFQGRENRLVMYQSYTKSFQCQYKLQKYPFDKQVGI